MPGTFSSAQVVRMRETIAAVLNGSTRGGADMPPADASMAQDEVL